MLKLVVVLASILLIAVSVGCLQQANTNAPLSTSLATTTLTISAPSVNQSEYATFACQLSVTQGPGLNNKAIRWSIDNVNKETTRHCMGVRDVELDHT